MKGEIDFNHLRESLARFERSLRQAAEPSGHDRELRLQERARQLAAKLHGASGEATDTWLLCGIRERRLAIRVSELRAVIACPPITRLPPRRGSPAGIIAHRGQFAGVWTVFDACEAETLHRGGGHYAVLLRGTQHASFICDSLDDIVTVAESLIDCPDAEVDAASFVFDDKPITVVSATDICKDRVTSREATS